MTRYNRNKPIKRNRKGKKYYRGAKQKWLSRVPLPSSLLQYIPV